MELLSDVDTGLLTFDHIDDAQQMAVRTFQPLDDSGVGCVNDVFCHMGDITPWGMRQVGQNPQKRAV
jgi:hypothetical protein